MRQQDVVRLYDELTPSRALAPFPSPWYNRISLTEPTKSSWCQLPTRAAVCTSTPRRSPDSRCAFPRRYGAPSLVVFHPHFCALSGGVVMAQCSGGSLVVGQFLSPLHCAQR